jgi:hypothetical protein
MNDHGNLKDFVEETRVLVKDWVETQVNIQKLKMVKTGSKIAGNLIWMIVMLFLASLFIIFLGVTAGYWLSELTGSMVEGFGIVTGFILIMIILLVLLRKKLFINPVMRKMIGAIMGEEESS